MPLQKNPQSLRMKNLHPQNGQDRRVPQNPKPGSISKITSISENCANKPAIPVRSPNRGCSDNMTTNTAPPDLQLKTMMSSGFPSKSGNLAMNPLPKNGFLICTHNHLVDKKSNLWLLMHSYLTIIKFRKLDFMKKINARLSFCPAPTTFVRRNSSNLLHKLSKEGFNTPY